jgi:hypothetical protein
MFFVYRISKNGTLWFYHGLENNEIIWGADPNKSESFSSHKKAQDFADENNAIICCGDPQALQRIHNRGPRIGDRVRITRKRSDGFVYGCGQVIRYADYTPHTLTHVVRLDNPPEKGAPDETGHTYDLTEYNGCFHFHAYELELG